MMNQAQQAFGAATGQQTEQIRQTEQQLQHLDLVHAQNAEKYADYFVTAFIDVAKTLYTSQNGQSLEESIAAATEFTEAVRTAALQYRASVIPNTPVAQDITFARKVLQARIGQLRGNDIMASQQENVSNMKEAN